MVDRPPHLHTEDLSLPRSVTERLLGGFVIATSTAAAYFTEQANAPGSNVAAYLWGTFAVASMARELYQDFR